MAFIRSELRDAQRVRDEPRRPTKRPAKDDIIHGRIPRASLALGKVVQEYLRTREEHFRRSRVGNANSWERPFFQRCGQRDPAIDALRVARATRHLENIGIIEAYDLDLCSG